MSLLMVCVLVLLTPLSLLGAFRAFKLEPTTGNRILAVALLLTAFAIALVCAVLVPSARMLDAQSEAKREDIRFATQIAQVRTLIKELGGPQAYIEYLKVTKSE